MEGPFQGGLLKAYDKRGREVVNRWMEDEADLANHIGQEAAKKLLAAEPKESYDSGMGARRRSLEDAELEVGGEGMKGFYDKILPETVNKLVKKYGSKVESGKVETRKEFIRDPVFGDYHEEMQYADVHQIDLTDKLKEVAVEQGFPAFAKKLTHANDSIRDSRAHNYDSAVRDQIIKRHIDNGAIIKSYAQWEEWAKTSGWKYEGRMRNGQENPFSAAAGASENGTPTILVQPNGRRHLFVNGSKLTSDRMPEGYPIFSLDNRLDFPRAEAAGLDAKSFKRIQDLIQKRYQEDIAAAMKRAEAEQKTLQSKEWKEAAKEIRKEVDADIRQRPDVAADLLIGSGELGGKQLERKNYPLRAEDLTAEQKASLPRRYYSNDGVPVDVMANLFGFTSGDRLVEDLSAYTKSREGMSAQEGLRKTIDEEV